MTSPDIQLTPLPGEVWLSRPPYLMLARIRDLDAASEPALVSYELHDADGTVLQRVDRAPLDGGWWRTFQPLQARYG
jgi:hypothetical protein